MKRYYFVNDNLNDLESIESELEQRGITTLQIHVLSQRDADVKMHKLNEVISFLKHDVVRSAILGAAVGFAACLLILSVVHTTGLANSAAGWAPFLFLAIVLLGFCTWEGGLKGIQEPNHRFRRFQKELQDGKHIFFVDVDPNEERILQQVAASHPNLQAAGTEPAGAHWIVAWQQKGLNFIKALP
ncbi:MAG: NAD/FAD-utilizing enzyme [Verrucomicrobiaceae bacterium]|nr:NAD/FAD-utilizing enzyme [Verrucomicrobiaceae bacterium]